MPSLTSFSVAYTLKDRIHLALLFIWAFIQSTMVSLTNFLNRYSRDYRYVLRVLAQEKKYLKVFFSTRMCFYNFYVTRFQENTNYQVGLRVGNSQVWQPSGSYGSLLKQSL